MGIRILLQEDWSSYGLGTNPGDESKHWKNNLSGGGSTEIPAKVVVDQWFGGAQAVEHKAISNRKRNELLPVQNPGLPGGRYFRMSPLNGPYPQPWSVGLISLRIDPSSTFMDVVWGSGETKGTTVFQCHGTRTAPEPSRTPNLAIRFYKDRGWGITRRSQSDALGVDSEGQAVSERSGEIGGGMPPGFALGDVYRIVWAARWDYRPGYGELRAWVIDDMGNPPPFAQPSATDLGANCYNDRVGPYPVQGFYASAMQHEENYAYEMLVHHGPCAYAECDTDEELEQVYSDMLEFAGGTGLPMPTYSIQESGEDLNGEAVSGTITASITPTTGVTQVRWWIDKATTETPDETDSGSPWEIEIDTATLADGSHSLEAEVTDGSGVSFVSVQFSSTNVSAPSSLVLHEPFTYGDGLDPDGDTPSVAWSGFSWIAQGWSVLGNQAQCTEAGAMLAGLVPASASRYVIQADFNLNGADNRPAIKFGCANPVADSVPFGFSLFLRTGTGQLRYSEHLSEDSGRIDANAGVTIDDMNTYRLIAECDEVAQTVRYELYDVTGDASVYSAVIADWVPYGRYFVIEGRSVNTTLIVDDIRVLSDDLVAYSADQKPFEFFEIDATMAMASSTLDVDVETLFGITDLSTNDYFFQPTTSNANGQPGDPGGMDNKANVSRTMARWSVADPSTLRFTRSQSGLDLQIVGVLTRVRDAGQSGARILLNTVEVMTASAQSTLAVPGVVARSRLWPKITGLLYSEATDDWEKAACTIERSASADEVIVNALYAKDREVNVTVLEMGADWVVDQYKPTVTEAEAVETLTISDVGDASQALVDATFVGNSTDAAAWSLITFLRDATTLAWYLPASSVPAHALVAFVLSHESLSVEHLRSVRLGGSAEALATGTATAGGASTLTDSGESWTTNEHAGRLVAIVAGTGAGQVRSISSNTATVLTVGSAWGTQPDGTSEYAIGEDWQEGTFGTSQAESLSFTGVADYSRFMLSISAGSDNTASARNPAHVWAVRRTGDGLAEAVRNLRNGTTPFALQAILQPKVEIYPPPISVQVVGVSWNQIRFQAAIDPQSLQSPAYWTCRRADGSDLFRIAYGGALDHTVTLPSTPVSPANREFGPYDLHLESADGTLSSSATGLLATTTPVRVEMDLVDRLGVNIGAVSGLKVVAFSKPGVEPGASTDVAVVAADAQGHISVNLPSSLVLPDAQIAVAVEIPAPAMSVTGATRDNPCALTVTAHGLADGQRVYVGGFPVGSMEELNGVRAPVTVLDVDTIELQGVDSSAYTVYTSGGSVKPDSKRALVDETVLG